MSGLIEARESRKIHEPFLLAALGIALTFGFGFAIVLIEAIGHRAVLGAWWLPLVQAHGHAQLFGWLGLFVLGMALYFLPRLVSTQLQSAERAPRALGLLVAGIILRGIAQPALGLVESASDYAMLARAAWLVSAILEIAGALVIASMLIQTHHTVKALPPQAPGYPVLPLALIALPSFALALVFNLLGTLDAFLNQRAAISGAWDSAIITVMLYGAAIPMAFVFSVRNLPLFLRLALPPRELLRPLAAIYAFGLLLRVAPFAPIGASIGILLTSAVILVFVWQLDLIRRQPPWIVSRAPNSRPDLDYLRKPTRPNYPDAGEYGRFELLIYSAYAWLVFATLLDLARAASNLLALDWNLPADAARHALTIGFISLMIFGMAARLAPGFSGKTRLAHPRLVAATFFLGNLAAFFRVAPLFFSGSDFAALLLAPSGAFGWLAVAGLAYNLVRTFRLETRAGGIQR
ncbi:MAG: NnrS family protein [Chloroflexi bacterium]|nr:NnrS family protein [Chloroflexota bacterium]